MKKNAGKQLLLWLNTLLARTLATGQGELIGCCNVTRYALRRLQPFIDTCDLPIVFSLGDNDSVTIACPGLCEVWDDLVTIDRQLRDACQGRYHELPPRIFQDKDNETLFLELVACIKFVEQSCQKYAKIVETLQGHASHHVVLETAMAYTNHRE